MVHGRCCCCTRLARPSRPKVAQGTAMARASSPRHSAPQRKRGLFCFQTNSSMTARACRRRRELERHTTVPRNSEGWNVAARSRRREGRAATKQWSQTMGIYLLKWELPVASLGLLLRQHGMTRPHPHRCLHPRRPPLYWLQQSCSQHPGKFVSVR